MRTSILWSLPMLLPAGSGCGFHPAVPVSNVCSFLSLDDARTLVPTLTSLQEQPPVDGPDLWARACGFTGPALPSVGLVISGALTPRGEQFIDDDFSGVQTSDVQVFLVSGLGEKAVYLTYRGQFQGLEARSGSYEVYVGVRFRPGPASIEELRPLVRKALSELP